MQFTVRRIQNFTYQGANFDLVRVIFDTQGVPPLLPLLYTLHMSRFGCVYAEIDATDDVSGKKLRCIVKSEITDNTVRAYTYALASFLSHLDDTQTNPCSNPSHASSSCDETVINRYLNEILPLQLDSPNSLNNHCSALKAYFTWLYYMDLAPQRHLAISRKSKQAMYEKLDAPNYIQYLSKTKRLKLLNSCKSLCEKLIIRMGYEVGLRTSEVAGLELEGTNGLRDLFSVLEDPSSAYLERFRYLLKGKYTKRGKSRWIYFDRELLRDLRRYCDTERKWLLDFTGGAPQVMLFLRTDHRFRGTPIGSEHASRIFRVRAMQAGLSALYHFHDLRHTFATELFHEELNSNPGWENRSESAALIVVAQRLGHAFGNTGQAPATTTRYIRTRIQMLEIEGCRDENGNR